MRSFGFLSVKHALGLLAEGVLTPLYTIACCLSSGLSRHLMRIGIIPSYSTSMMVLLGSPSTALLTAMTCLRHDQTHPCISCSSQRRGRQAQYSHSLPCSWPVSVISLSTARPTSDQGPRDATGVGPCRPRPRCRSALKKNAASWYYPRKFSFSSYPNDRFYLWGVSHMVSICSSVFPLVSGTNKQTNTTRIPQKTP